MCEEGIERAASLGRRTFARLGLGLWRMERATRKIGSALRSLARWLIRSVLDFLVEDVCALCRKGPGQAVYPQPVGPRGSSADPCAALCRPVEVSVLPSITVENRPVCARCAREFDEALDTGVLGSLVPDRSVALSPGEAHCGNKGIWAYEPSGDGSGSLSGEPRIIKVISPWMINDQVLKVVHLIKYKSYIELVPLVAASICEAITRFSWGIEEGSIIIPVPMHREDERRRGFNQAELLSEQLSRALGIPLGRGVLEKVVRTRRQSKLKGEERVENVAGVFVVRGGSLAGRHVLLVDDVVTTGATVCSCAEAIFRAGAASLSVLCFGRAL